MARVRPVLGTGATARIGAAVVDRLLDAGVPVRALSRRAVAAATLAANVEVVTGDLTVPESLGPGLHGVGAVFLVWTAPSMSAAAHTLNGPSDLSAEAGPSLRLHERIDA